MTTQESGLQAETDASHGDFRLSGIGYAAIAKLKHVTITLLLTSLKLASFRF